MSRFGVARGALSSRARLVVGAAGVAVVAMVSFRGSLDHGFIYDDYWTVVGNGHLDGSLRGLLSQALSGRNVELGVPDATRPAMTVSLWLDRWAFSLRPAGYHAHSLALYAGVCVSAYLLAFGVMRSFFRALSAGLLFAAMPLHAEVVAAINYREDLQAALGVLGGAALLFWPAPRGRDVRGPLVALAWLYGLLGKESALVGPLVVAALCLARPLPRGRSQASAPVWLWPAAAALVWLSWRFGVSVLGEPIPRASHGSVLATTLATARYSMQALVSSLAPFETTPEYPVLAAASPAWLPALLAVVASLIVSRRRRALRWVLTAMAFALSASILTSPLVAPVNERADRYFFVGSFGAALIGAWLLAELYRRSERGAWAALGGSLLTLGWLSTSATSVWASETNLWTRAVDAAPSSARAWAQLSRVHRIAGQHELSEWALEQSLARRADYVPARVAAVFNSLSEGDLRRARQRLREVAPETSLHSAALRVAARCARSETPAAARECAHRSVPRGLVVGDLEVLRAFTESLRASRPGPDPGTVGTD